MGKVYCKVDAGYAPVAAGDLLTSSPTPGHAMKAANPARAFGSVIGKALRPLREGQLKLVLEPTRQVSGKVNLGRTSHTRVDVVGVVVGDPSGAYALVAPVGVDGSFAMAGVPMGAFRIGASVRADTELDGDIDYHDVPASTAPVTGVTLEPTSSTRVLDIVVTV